jgi:hypothetical protein
LELIATRGHRDSIGSGTRSLPRCIHTYRIITYRVPNTPIRCACAETASHVRGSRERTPKVFLLAGALTNVNFELHFNLRV